ncbi:MAG: class I SAM-dependent methyltransferase [Thermoplasmatota archaeon]
MSFFDAMYEGSPPPWDIGRPQPALLEALAKEPKGGRVLDVGCGTGENVLGAAAMGRPVIGIDSAPRAIGKAESKRHTRHVPAAFAVSDVLSLPLRSQVVSTVIDSGCFHTLSDEDRGRYRSSVARVLAAGGHLHIMAFSEREPNWGGPRRVTQQELRDTFEGDFEVEDIRAARFAVRQGPDGAHAWLASFLRRP